MIKILFKNFRTRLEDMRRLYNADVNDVTPERSDLRTVGDLLNMMFPVSKGLAPERFTA